MKPEKPKPTSKCRVMWETFNGVGYETTEEYVKEWRSKPWYIRLFTSPKKRAN